MQYGQQPYHKHRPIIIIIILSLIICIPSRLKAQNSHPLPRSSSNTQPNNSPKTPTQVVVPTDQSAEYYYQRALVYHLKDQDGRATIELYKALEKDPTDVKVNFFLALLFKDREHWDELADTLFKVIGASTVEHTPARLLLARASLEQNKYPQAMDMLDKVSHTLKLDSNFLLKIQRCRTDATRQNLDPNSKYKIDVHKEVLDLIDELQDHMIETPAAYRVATINLGLSDPIIYNDLAALYEEDEQPKEALEVLKESVAKNNNFCPALLLQLGRLYQQESRTKDAIIVLEQAEHQLTALGFSEAKGDFSTDELKVLKNAVTTAKAPKH